VEIIVLVSNGLVFQNDKLPMQTKDALGILMVIVIVCLVIVGVQGEARRKLKKFLNRKKVKETPSENELYGTPVPTVTTMASASNMNVVF
jgi:hypothetical protein